LFGVVYGTDSSLKMLSSTLLLHPRSPLPTSCVQAPQREDKYKPGNPHYSLQWPPSPSDTITNIIVRSQFMSVNAASRDASSIGSDLGRGPLRVTDQRIHIRAFLDLGLCRTSFDSFRGWYRMKMAEVHFGLPIQLSSVLII